MTPTNTPTEMTAEEWTEDIYKAITPSSRNDAYEAYHYLQFVSNVLPIIEEIIDAARREQAETDARICDAEAETWVGNSVLGHEAATNCADAIRSAAIRAAQGREK